MAKAAQNIQELSLEDVMGDRFGRYSKYIIQERALPDIRDGLKPVQRRILYAMYLDGNTYDKAFRKSAKSVGNIMGNFHPHGDSSIYEAMVRLSQNWKLREPLIEMHGNNGSMDGDPPAAMRYTEARLSKISAELLRDIDKDTVDMVLNFDDTEKEPTVLPARFPNLLVNGATGISAGYATEIPPHNLGEVIDAFVYLVDHPQADLADLMQFVKGPDFPTGGILQGLAGIKEAYTTGRGKAVLRSKTAIVPIRGHREQIVITEIPYDVNKAQLVKKIDEVRVLKKVDGISEVRDESDRLGLSIVIELKKQADAQGILNYLFKNTDLQITYNFNIVAISDMRPKQVGLVEILQSYLQHQQDVLTRRTQYNLKKAQDRQHIVEGLIKALSILDKVIKTIRASKDKKSAKVKLQADYGFSELQAEAIVVLQLYRLTNTDVTELQKEHDQLSKDITRYTDILEHPASLAKLIKKEALGVKKQYVSPRKTQIEKEIEAITINTSVLVSDEEVRVAVTRDGYFKRSSLRSYQASVSKDPKDNGIRENDQFVLNTVAGTLQHLFIFTSKGNMIYRPIHEIDDVRWKEVGEHISQSVGLDGSESIVAAYVVPKLDMALNFVLATKYGQIKQVELANLQPNRTYKSKPQLAIKLKQAEDEVLQVYQIQTAAVSQFEVVSATHLGYGVRYPLAEVPAVGAKAAGVKAMDLKPDDYIVSFILTDSAKDSLGLLTQRGAFKQMHLSELPISSRARRGVLLLRELKRNPHRIFALIKEPADLSQVKAVDILTTTGVRIQIDPKTHNFGDRYSNGSFVMDVETQGDPKEIKLINYPQDVGDNGSDTKKSD
ncbi:parC protein [Agrilactobacillus composti DSM 18527 = JCM 14202]|uniref:DNA topoisomerase 4 subunit A n=1 Tax=Agrilactobacillus composti DSM 18527 = JCM 14202 TaxID=1423734 RepID=X0QKM8_9LACO|nr:DNA topoisomerase IV subunit A [Agrilactobacillus composti]KRM36527.1 parC protein [Agrilactobacillus composti DSM 18527 = JCM 14202]GAF39165.1 topoisomerase IV subunit A [Agrilactobacillus composti DSM 18527 = JCM 14202]